MWKIDDDLTAVLLQSTRRRLFALLEELGRPASTRELAQGLGLHPNALRNRAYRIRSKLEACVSHCLESDMKRRNSHSEMRPKWEDAEK